MFMTISNNVKEDLKKALEREPDLITSRGALFISKNVPAACISLGIPRKEYLRFVLDLPGFKHAYKVIPVDGEPFDIVVLGTVEVDGPAITIDGKAAQIL